MRLRVVPGPVSRVRDLLGEVAEARTRLERLERRLASVRVGVAEEALLRPPTQEDLDRLHDDVLDLVERAVRHHGHPSSTPAVPHSPHSPHGG